MVHKAVNSVCYRQAGADPKSKNKIGGPLFDAAAHTKHAGVITALVAAGADPNYWDILGRSPLIRAAIRGNLVAVIALLAAGADVNARDDQERTALIWAAYFSEDGRVATALLEAGADINARSIYGNTPLHGAIRSSSAAKITILVAAGADINARDEFGNSAQQLAASYGFSTVIQDAALTAAAAQEKEAAERLRATFVSCDKWNTTEFFRHAGAADVSRCLKTKDPNARDDKGRTPLHTAATVSKNPAVVATLAKAGAELDARDEEGRTPLHLAVVFGRSPAFVTALVKAGADISMLDKKGRTPLQFAEKFSETPALVNALKKAEDAPVASVVPGSLLLCEKWNTAAFFKNAGVADLSRCLETEDPDARNENGRTPLHYAAQGSAPAFVTALAKAGGELDARDKRGGWTPLHLAAWFGKSQTVVQALLDAGADPEAKDDTGRTPWHYLKENPALKDFDPRVATVSCEDWNTALFFERANAADVSRCLKGGAKANARDAAGATPLHLAARHGKTPDVVAALVEAGAGVSARDETGATPLHAAAMKSAAPTVVQALLDAGADPAAADEAGKTPGDYAKSNPALADADLHERLAAISCEDWNTASFFERAEPADVSRCVEVGASARVRDETGATPLHLAAQHGKTPDVVVALVEAGGRVSARDETGATPLHTAASEGTTAAIVQALLIAGADPEAKDESGKTPWDYLKENPGLKGADLSRRLAGVSCEDWNTAPFFERADTADVSRCLKDGAEVSARDEAEATPLHLAASKSEVPAVVQVLLKAGADPAARDKQGKVPWDFAKTNPALKGTEVYWQLNEGRFN